MTREADFYKNFIKLILGVIIQKHINSLQYQLVMQKQQKNNVSTSSPSAKISPNVMY